LLLENISVSSVFNQWLICEIGQISENMVTRPSPIGATYEQPRASEHRERRPG
jgi:hypothetical protein